jgi:hypothetical protein
MNMIKIDPSQPATAFRDALGQGAPLRVQAITRLDQSHQQQDAALKFEQNRIVSRYGSDSAKAKAIQARVTAHATRGLTIAAEVKRAQVSVPEPAADQYVIYGFVRDSSGEGLKGIRIAAAGSKSKALASTVTGPQGGFELRVPAAAVSPSGKSSAAARAQDAQGAKVTADAEETERIKRAGTIEMGGKGHSVPPVRSFQLVLTNNAKKTTYRYPEIFEPKGGFLAYREIAVPSTPAA